MSLIYSSQTPSEQAQDKFNIMSSKALLGNCTYLSTHCRTGSLQDIFTNLPSKNFLISNTWRIILEYTQNRFLCLNAENPADFLFKTDFIYF